VGLRRKTQIIIGFVLLGLLLVLYAVTRNTLLVQFSRLEEQQTRQSVDRVSNALANELDLLNGSARDDSMWDEARDFVRHPQPGWGENAFGVDAFTYLRLNVLAYFDLNVQPVYAREFDGQAHQEKLVRAEMVKELSSLAQGLLRSSSPQGKGGIVELPDGPMLVAVWPVLSSSGKGPVWGALIMGRWLDATERERLGWTQSLQFGVSPAHSLQPASDSYSALAHLSGAMPIFVSPLSENQVAGYTLLKDIEGNPSILLRVITPRNVYQQGRTALHYLMFVTLFVGAVFTLVNVALLDRMILSRVIALGRAVSSIGASSDLAQRVPASGNDELSHLAVSINRMLATLEDSEKDLRLQALAMEASADGIAILNDRAEFAYMNRAHAVIFGYDDLREMLSKSWKILYGPVETARMEQEIMPLVARDGRWEGEAVAQRRDGSSFPQQVSVAALPDGGFVCVCRDLTEQRRIEDQLRKKQRMEAIGTLAGGIAHDFNNLLTVILGYSQTLLAKLETHAEIRSNVERIVNAATRAASLTRQLLAFSRKQVLQPRVLSLNAVVHELEKILRPLVGEDIEMIANCAPDLGAVKADFSQIEQVIVNLVVNARDALPRGGSLVLTTANLDVGPADALRYPDLPPGRYVRLSVADTGVGMNREVLSHMFEPFFTTKEVGRGTGLGLSTVYGIVRQSDGYIWVESEPGQGSTFTVCLPRVQATPEPLPQERAPSWGKQGTETILLVEDDNSVRELAQDILRSCGYRVLVAANAPQLDSLLAQHCETIHLLITDVVMPFMNGREVAKRVQSQHPETQVLYMSGYAYDTIVQRGILDGGFFFIQKPYTPSQLVEKVREVLDHAKIRVTATS